MTDSRPTPRTEAGKRLLDFIANHMGLSGEVYAGIEGDDDATPAILAIEAEAAQQARAATPAEPDRAEPPPCFEVEAERDMAEAYYKTLETHLREHGCGHDFSEVANENGLTGWAEARPTEGLDPAWAAAEAALPEGWRLRVVGPNPPALPTPGPYYAEASQPFAQSFVPEGQQHGFVLASGLTPAAALRALAARLSADSAGAPE